MRTETAAALLFLCAVSTAAPAGLVISEILAGPIEEPGSPGAREWVELWNRGPGAIDLEGWSLNDGKEDDLLVALEPGGATLLAPRCFALILDPDRPPLDAPWPRGTLLMTVDDRSIGNGLSPSDRLRIAPPFGRGAACYFAATERAPPDPGRGLSIERVDLGRGGCEGDEGWRPSRLVGGTPGALNSAGLEMARADLAGARRWARRGGELGLDLSAWSASWMAGERSIALGGGEGRAQLRAATAADGSATLALRLGPDPEGRVLHLFVDLGPGSLLPGRFGDAPMGPAR